MTLGVSAPIRLLRGDGFNSRQVEDLFGWEIFLAALAHGQLRAGHMLKYKYAKQNNEINHSTNDNCGIKSNIEILKAKCSSGRSAGIYYLRIIVADMD